MSAAVKAIEDLGRAFEEYRATVDSRIDQIEANGAPRADTEEKLAKINAEMDRLQDVIANLETQAQRPRAGEVSPADREHAEAFNRWIRTGDVGNLKELQIRASVNVGTGAEGEYAVPEVIDSAVHDILVDISPIRGISQVVNTTTGDYKKLVNVRGTASGWVGEQDPRPETTAPQLAEIAPAMGEIYANPYATQHALDDIFFDVEQWLSSEVSTEFAKQEGDAFINGDGTNKPQGFLTGPVTTEDDDARAFGTLQYFPTGAAGGFAATDPHEVFIDTVYGLKAGHRARARWTIARALLAEVRKMKDGDGNLIWQPGLAAGQPQTLMGYPITEAEDMPAQAADSLSIAFGDFFDGYLIADRVGIRMLRDPYSAKPYITFYSTMRVGGKLLDSNAIKLIRFSVA